MNINSLTVEEKSSGWKLNHLDFSKFTLLVGASGVGKTKILRTIVRLKHIALYSTLRKDYRSRASSFNGFKWEVKFGIDDVKYQWSGEFECLDFYENRDARIPFFFDDKDLPRPKIIKENLYVGGDLVISRDGDGIIFNGAKTVKLSQEESAISLLKEEDVISPIISGFSRIDSEHLNVDDSALFSMSPFDNDFNESEFVSIEDIKNSSASIYRKAYLCSIHHPDIFRKIVDSYIDVFPYVEDVQLEYIIDNDLPSSFRPTCIKIKEKDVSGWVLHDSISSGMKKTFRQLAGLYLSQKGTVVLVDEFENGFGVNCIHDVSDAILSSGNDIQFIITSHHPYIINRVPLEHWKIISRKAGVVNSHDASEFNLEDSSHDSFIKLINLGLYADGADA